MKPLHKGCLLTQHLHLWTVRVEAPSQRAPAEPQQVQFVNVSYAILFLLYIMQWVIFINVTMSLLLSLHIHIPLETSFICICHVNHSDCGVHWCVF